MNHGAMIAIHAGAAAGAAAAKARTRVLDAFRIRGATAPERALPLTELGLPSDDRALAAFVKSGVVRGVDPRGRPAVIGYEESRIEGYYLDESAFVAERDRTAKRSEKVVLVVIAITVVLLAIPLLFLAAGAK